MSPFPAMPEIPDDDPPAALRLLWRYLQAVFRHVSIPKAALIVTPLVGVAIGAAYCFLGLDQTLSWLSDFVPMSIALVGIIMSYKQPREKNHLAATTVLILAGVVGTGVLHWSRARDYAAHKAEVGGLNGKMDTVRNQNIEILLQLSGFRSATPQTPQAAEVERRSNIQKVLRGEYILSHENISAGLLAGTELPPAEWMNKRLAELGEKWTVAQPVVRVSVSPNSPCVPGRPRINAGPDGYRGVCDEDVGAWVIQEAERIGTLGEACIQRELQNKADKMVEDFQFRNEFNSCCKQETKELRAEAISRLGPANKSSREQEMWERVFPEDRKDLVALPADMRDKILGPAQFRDPDCWDVQRYAPFLRQLGMRLKRRVIPRKPPVSLEFSESPAPVKGAYNPNVKVVGIAVAIKTKVAVESGYVVVEFGGGHWAYLNSDAPRRSFQPMGPDIDNKALTDYVALLPDAHNVYILNVAGSGFSPTKDLHVEAVGTDTFHTTKVTLFDE